MVFIEISLVIIDWFVYNLGILLLWISPEQILYFSLKVTHIFSSGVSEEFIFQNVEFMILTKIVNTDKDPVLLSATSNQNELLSNFKAKHSPLSKIPLGFTRMSCSKLFCG